MGWPGWCSSGVCSGSTEWGFSKLGSSSGAVVGHRKMLRGHKHNVVIILKMLQIITTLWFHLIPKPYSDYG